MGDSLTVSYDRYDVVYAVCENGKYLDSYVLHDGYKLFAVGATYALSLKPSEYYVVAQNIRHARKIFMDTHGDILSYIKYIKQVPAEQQEFLLNNYIEHPTIII